MIALLALAAAVGWGSSDFAAGVASRRATAMSVVILTHLTATFALALVTIDPDSLRGIGIIMGRRAEGGGSQSLLTELTLPAVRILGHPTLVDLGWGALAGVSGGIGALLLFKGLAKGSMAVVAPITAAGAAALPAIFGLLSGDPASPLVLGGIALALLGITLVSSVAPTPDTDALDAAADGPETSWASVHAAPGWATELSDDELIQRAFGALDAIGAGTVSAARQPPVFAYIIATAAAVIAGALTAMTTSVLLGTSAPPAAGVFLAAFGAVALLSAGATGVGHIRGKRSTSRARSGREAPRRNRLRSPGVVEALGSGIGFALFYILVAHAGEDAGLWPMVTARGASVVMFTIAALLTRVAVFPARGSRWTVVLAGAADAAAAGLFLVSTHSGSLAVVSVLSSMYPAVTVILARVITKERCTKLQLFGLGVAATAVGLIAVG